jgi:uncharacterized membrane protein
MRLRFLSFLALGTMAVVTLVASTAFTEAAIAAMALGVGIGMLTVSLGVAAWYWRHRPSLIVGAVAAVVSAWQVIASQVFSLVTVQNLTLASAIAISALAAVGLVGHELSTERVVHELDVRAGERAPQTQMAA